VGTAKQPEPRKAAHAFNHDSAIPPDFHGRIYCADCGKPGRDGDAQHPFGALPAIRQRYPEPPPGTAELEARILGEAQR
jgi:hypothetical protein